MNESQIDAFEQERECVQGTVDVAFCIAADEAALRTSVAAGDRAIALFQTSHA